MSHDEKIRKLIRKLKTDAEDLYQLVDMLKEEYEREEDTSYIMENILTVKDDIIKTTNTLKKEI